MKFSRGYEDSDDGIWRIGRDYGKATVVFGFGMNPDGVLGLRDREIESLSLYRFLVREGFAKYERNNFFWLLYPLLNAVFRLPLKLRSARPLAGHPTQSRSDLDPTPGPFLRTLPSCDPHVWRRVIRPNTRSLTLKGPFDLCLTSL